MKNNIHVGQRIVKTAVAVLICFLIYFLRGQKGIPFYSAIAAILCMQPYGENSFTVAKNRMIGTLVGAFFGTILLTFYYFQWIEMHVMYLLIAFCIILVIKTSVWIKKPQVAYFSCVVFLSIATNHINDEVPYFFIMDRVIDTFIGIGVSLTVNAVHFPRRKRKNLLFVSELDDTLLKKDGSLSDYTKVDLNRLIADGANFTIATERTPATLMDSIRDIHMNLPIIAMNGAVLYDMENNKYVKKCLIDTKTTKDITLLLRELQVGFFINVFIQDILLIRCEDFKNTAMQTIYRMLCKSPYRNYLYGPLQEGEQAAYFFVVDTQEKIDIAIAAMEQKQWKTTIRYMTGVETRVPGYSYLKIYRKEASKESMIAYLRDMIRAEKVMTFGSVEGQYDVIAGEEDENLVVKQMKKIYEPVFWERTDLK